MGDIVSVINTLAENVYSSIEQEVFVFLDEMLVIDKKILKLDIFKKLSFSSEDNYIILLALCFVTMFVICFGIKKIINMYSGSNDANTWKFVLKLIVSTMLMVSSYFLIETLLDINNMITEVLKSIGEETTGYEISFETLKTVINKIDTSSGFLSLNGAIKGLAGFGAVTVLINFCIRYITVVFLILVSPIAFMLSINDSTFGMFSQWLKLTISNLIIQNIVILVVMIPLSTKDMESNIFKILLVGSIYILYKVNSFVFEITAGFNIRKGNE